MGPDPQPEPVVAPYGAWRSPIRVEEVVGDVILLNEPWIDGDDIFWLEGRPAEDGRHVLVRAAADAPVPITPDGPWRYADLRLDPVRRRFYAVREDHSGDAEPANTIVTIPLDGGDPQVLVKGSDFVAAPRLSPDGTRLAWLEWDHPDMPWDATLLKVAAFEPDGTLGEAILEIGRAHV